MMKGICVSLFVLFLLSGCRTYYCVRLGQDRYYCVTKNFKNHKWHTVQNCLEVDFILKKDLFLRDKQSKWENMELKRRIKNYVRHLYNGKVR